MNVYGVRLPSRSHPVTLAPVPRDPQPDAGPAGTTFEHALIVLAAVAAWSIVPPYLGPAIGLPLDVPATVELVDHVLPGLISIAAASLAFYESRQGRSDGTRALAALGACTLAGLFQTVSHAPLVLQAAELQEPVGAVVLHATPGPVLLMLSLWLLLRPERDEVGS